MLIPRRLKHRKQFRPDLGGIAWRGNELNFGDFGLRAEKAGRLSSRQIEAARKAMTHFIKRGGRVWIRVFPDRPVTKKPPETRMGGGKGDFFEFVVPIKTGAIIFEMSGITEDIAREALRLASHKLPLRTSFVRKQEL